ncbi:outer membrane usher protein [Klebsiella aerogenes]|uniref:outer membrane usher protein n=1 Tax=Klebsiella aerogenes TaxID=548 RepID=UPI000DA2303F|nr:outer membrane usher protein [Klebsiella aerogenes]
MAQAADDIQFNTDVLDVKDRANISLDQFSRAGYMMPGDYTFTVVVNGHSLNDERTITYYQDEKDKNNSLVCVPKSVANELGLKEKFFNQLTWWHDGGCIELSSLEGMTATGNMSDATLNISIPQAFMEYVSDDWDPPSRWDNGVAGVIFDYNFNALSGRNHSDYSNGRYYNVSGNGTTGLNFGAWRLRADWQGYLNHDTGSGNDTTRNLDVTEVYAYRPLPSIKSKLTLGETYYNSDVFDSFRFVGGSLESDDNMLPPNLRGYAPEVTGVAKTNAKVTVSQKGRVLYETQVAPGPFRIQDLSDAVSGQLDVKVTEQNGQVQTFTVNTSDIPYLTRPGTLRYKLAVGKPEGYEYHDPHVEEGDENAADYADDTYSDMHHTYGAPVFAGGEFSWGINSGWSLYGGGIGSKDYNALSVGLGRDLLQFGAVALDASVARTVLPFDDDTKMGSSYRLSYSKDFDEYDSQVTFAGYRFSTRDFMTMDEYLDARNDGNTTDNDKQMYTVTFNKQFKDQGLSIYLNYSHETYWDSPKNNNFNLSMSKTFDAFGLHNISTSLTAYKNQYDNMDDYGAYLSLSLPIGDNTTVSLNSSVGNQHTSNEVSYFHTIDANNNYELAAGGSDGDATSRAYFSHLGDMAEVDANANYQSGTSSSVGLTLRGGLTATTHGVALHRVNQLGGTRMMVDTEGVSDVPVEGFGGISRTNMFGKAVVADINSYYRSSASIDLDKLNDNVDVSNSVVQGTLTEGAIGYRKFSVISGEKAMASLRLEDGSTPPFGATIFNRDGLQTGIVNEDGSVYLSGIQPDGKMTAKWDGQMCDITLPPKLPDLSSSLLLPCHNLRADEAKTHNQTAP